MVLSIRLVSLLLLGAILGIASASQNGFRTFSSAPVCASCRIQLVREHLLRPPSESVVFRSSSRLVALAGGELVAYDLLREANPALFDRTGRYVRTVARKGVGPGEIQYAAVIARVPGDSVWVVDGGRKLVFDPRMNYVRQDAGRRTGANLLVTPAGMSITDGITGGAATAGYPLHFLDNRFSIVNSFGTVDPTIDPRRLSATGDDATLFLMRQLTQADANSFWAYNQSRFLLERYDFRGRLLVALRHALDGWYATGTSRRPAMGDFKGLALHWVIASQTPNLIWLIYHDPRPEYDRLARWDHRQRVNTQDLVIEAFDTQRNAVLAVARFPRHSATGVEYGHDTIALVEFTDESFAYRITRLQLLR